MCVCPGRVCAAASPLSLTPALVARRGQSAEQSITSPFSRREARLGAAGTPFVLLAVDADQRTRYDRAYGRGSETDAVSYETFVEQERVEMTSDQPHEQNLSRCMALADARLTNDGTVEEFNAQIEEFLAAME